MNEEMHWGWLSVAFDMLVFMILPMWFGISQVRMMRKDREMREARQEAEREATENKVY